jgi:hypothetical protein
LNKDEDKEFIEKAFDWTLEIDGKKWADGKYKGSRVLKSSA